VYGDVRLASNFGSAESFNFCLNVLFLWFSIILRPKLRLAEAVKLTFVAGLAVAKVLGEMFGLKVETKWPNDVLVNGRKICGILTEMNTTCETVNFVVVGIGSTRTLMWKRSFQSRW
jgi:BirA family biotin operon repressor/biotin-[acetyl-CoA-carboxylase] ligase